MALSALLASLVLSALSSLLMVRQIQCWPLSSPEVLPEDEELEQRQIALKKQQAYNKHLASVLYALAYKNADSEQTLDGGDIFEHPLFYRPSRSNGKPTFIRFGKHAAPAFIRFGRSANDGIKLFKPHDPPTVEHKA